MDDFLKEVGIATGSSEAAIFTELDKGFDALQSLIPAEQQQKAAAVRDAILKVIAAKVKLDNQQAILDQLLGK